MLMKPHSVVYHLHSACVATLTSCSSVLFLLQFRQSHCHDMVSIAPSSDIYEIARILSICGLRKDIRKFSFPEAYILISCFPYKC